MRWELTAGNIRKSWAGAGSLEITGPDEDFAFRDYVIVFVLVGTVDLITLLLGSVFDQHPRALGLDGHTPFADPQTTIHNAVLHVWLVGVVAVLSIAASAAWKIGRAVVASLQAVIFVVVLIVAVFAILHAQGQLQELQLCHLGADGPCVGVNRIS